MIYEFQDMVVDVADHHGVTGQVVLSDIEGRAHTGTFSYDGFAGQLSFHFPTVHRGHVAPLLGQITADAREAWLANRDCLRGAN